MLDDLKLIHQRDKADALGIAGKQWQQLKHDFSKVTVEARGEIQNVVLAGMGGSALAAKLIKQAFEIQLPFEIVQEYTLPTYVGPQTLVIASSYSGNTEETLSCLEQAEARGAQVVVIAAGGALAKIAKDKKYPHFALPSGIQPRMAVCYNLAALTQLFVKMGLTVPEALDELQAAAAWLGPKLAGWQPTVPTAQNQAKQLAQECIGLSPVIYGGPVLYPVAYKWKIDFNENAKNVAWCNQFPEFNHNEFIGWSSHPVDKPYRIIFLQSSFDDAQVTKRFAVSEKLLSGKWPHPVEIEAVGDTRLRQVLWTIMLGDFVSIYTALLNNVDPTPVALVEKLKAELN